MTTVAGRYQVLREIGRGGMGVVLLAEDSKLGRNVALKRLLLSSDLPDSADARARLMREAQVTSRLSHPNIVTLYDVIEEEDELYLVLEYYESNSLADNIDTHGPLSEPAVRAIGAAVGGALAAAHDEGVLHRDVKPENILMGAKGVRLTDFGIARIVEAAGDATRLTRTGYYVGTPGYMSPEQIQGTPATGATDVFALGLILCYSLTGDDPFGTGEPAAMLYRIVHEEIDLDRIPASDQMKAVIAAATRKDPGERPDARTITEALGRGSGERRLPAPEAPTAAAPYASGMPGGASGEPTPPGLHAPAGPPPHPPAAPAPPFPVVQMPPAAMHPPPLGPGYPSRSKETRFKAIALVLAAIVAFIVLVFIFIVIAAISSGQA